MKPLIHQAMLPAGQAGLSTGHSGSTRHAMPVGNQQTARRSTRLGLACACVLLATSSIAAAAPADGDSVQPVPRQPLLAQTHRLGEAMEVLGNPLPETVLAELQKLKSIEDDAQVSARLQAVLDPLCLAHVRLDQAGIAAVLPGAAQPELLEQGWRAFLIKVENPHGLTGQLDIDSPNAEPLPHAPADEVASRWMQLSVFSGQPLRPSLSGLGFEYRIVQIYSRDAGTRQGVLRFSIRGGGDEDPATIARWRFDDDTAGWTAMNQSELSASGGALHITSTGEDPFVGANVDSEGGKMALRFWADTEVEGVAQLFWWTKERPQATADRQVNFLLKPGNEQLYEIPFRVNGQLAGIRFDPMNKPGMMRVDWIDLIHLEKAPPSVDLPLTFEAVTSTPVTFRIQDLPGLPQFACFEIRDATQRIYPAQSKRLAPDFFFQKHIYRGEGETVSLPPGQYTVVCSRGPESITETQTLTVGTVPVELHYHVRRWIDPAASGWWSGDHHIHAAGCLHYENPTQGVQPEDMIRHTMGEDLKVGCCLTWGPCFDFQKRFFTGDVAEQSKYPYTLRYDVEVSGFGSHNSGHLNLLQLTQQIYPGGESKEHWPTLGLNTLRWAKAQGAICGPAHSANGLTRMVGRLDGTENLDGPNRIPNFDIPAYDGIGANEFVVDVTHRVPGPDGTLVPAVDFISAMDTDRVAEWNMWYQVLNCGLRVVVSGETDFPCISGERVGMGRVYAHVDGPLTFDAWVDAVGRGRSYVSDGQCHLLDFQMETSGTGEIHQVRQVGDTQSDLRISSSEPCTISLDVGARLPTMENGEAPTIDVELIFNGYPIATQKIPADGQSRTVRFEQTFPESGWCAVRVYPHAHTNPIHVAVDGKPMTPRPASVRWCLAGVEQCWKTKQPTYALSEQADARAAFEHARRYYQSLLPTP